MSETSTQFATLPASVAIQNRMARMWFVSALGRGGEQVVQLLALIVLARLLVPEDFGLLAMVMAVVGVANIFRDMGLSAATVRARELTAADASALMLINIAFGAVMSAFIFGLSPVIASFYGDARLGELTRAVSWSFLLASMGTQHMALMRRQLKFGTIAWISLAAALLGQGAAVILAYHGFGYWSLVFAMLITQASQTLLAWTVNRWQPERPRLNDNVRHMISFGGNLMVFSLLGFIAFNIHSVVIGWRFGAQEVGYYSRAFAIISLLLAYVANPLGLVAPAALSRLLDQDTQYNETYLHTVAMMLLLTAPIGFLCVTAGADIVTTILGKGWSEAIPVLQILALAAVPQTLCASTGWLYMSHGDSRSMMQWGLFGWSSLILLVCIGTIFGIRGVAIGYSLGMYLLLYPCMAMALRRTTLSFADLVPICLPVVLPALLASGPAWLVRGVLENWEPLSRLAVVVMTYISVYLLLLVVIFRQGPLLTDVKNQLVHRGAVA